MYGKKKKTEKKGRCFWSEAAAQIPPFLFCFPFIILSPAISFLSSPHSQKTNKNNRDTTGWRGVNRREWRRDTDHFQQRLCHRNTTQTDEVILNVTTPQSVFLLQLKSKAVGQLDCASDAYGLTSILR